MAEENNTGRNSDYTGECRGFSLPFRIDPDRGGAAVQENESEKLKENIMHILLTGVGERVQRRKYGGGVAELVQDPNNDALRALARRQIALAVGKWENRVLLRDVVIVQREGTLIAELSYVIRRTQEPQNLAVPLSPGGI